MTVTGNIRARLKTQLEAIAPSIGIVHDFFRWTADDAKLQEISLDPAIGAIRAWLLTRETSDGAREAPAESRRYPVFVAYGYRAWNDAEASEKLFDDSVEAIQDALGADVTLGGLADHVDEPIVRVIEPRIWAGILCHHAEIALRIHLTKGYTLI